MSEERDYVVQQLSAHFAADRLTIDELERRLELVYRAQSSSELAALTADLPSPVNLPATHDGRGQLTGAIRTALGSVTRAGPMVVPARLEIRAVLGNIELDLRDAAFGPLTEIDVRCYFGNVELQLPVGVRVENDGTSVAGSFESHVPVGAMPMVGASPVVRITGRAVFGNVELRAQ